MKLYALAIFSLTLLIQGCGGGDGSGDGSGDGGDGNSNTAEVKQSDSETINDSFLSSQWYLKNTGQQGLDSSENTGTIGADINAFSSNNLTSENYANNFKGTGVEIAIIDSGLEINHEDLSANVIKDGSYNFVFPNNGKAQHDPTSTSTTGDHGTSVAGLAAARGGNGIGIWGVAPQASLRGFNFIASDQTLNIELAALGYQPSVSAFTGMSNESVAVFNKSYGINPIYIYEENTTEAQRTVQVLAAMQYGTETLRGGKGALYLKAAGNEYSGGSEFSSDWCRQAIEHKVTCFNANQEPENNTPYEIVVGAFNAKDQRARYSNTGASLWISAPGGDDIGLVTVDQSGCDKGFSATDSTHATGSFDIGGFSTGNEQCNYYASFIGTSAATPVASGVVALILEANPDLTWRDVKHILASTARRLDETLANNTINLAGQSVTIEQGWVQNAANYWFSNAYGFGAMNVQDAIAMAQQWKTAGTHLPEFVSSAQSTQIFNSENEIPSGSVVGLTKMQAVSASMALETVVLKLDISATTTGSLPNIDPSDYQVELISPSGTKSILLTPFNAYQSGYDMKGLTLASHAFYGESSAGTWTVKILDLDSSRGNRIRHIGLGKLNSFKLTLYGH